MRLALRPLRRLSLAAGLAALATLGACSILPEAQVLQVYLLPVHNPPASAAAGGGGGGGGGGPRPRQHGVGGARHARRPPRPRTRLWQG
ncbi:hypothetical protein OFL48_25310, partial [Pseudomonas aeruginosa]|nr:hypothetical protein [Pseudomonas aeruginosa]